MDAAFASCKLGKLPVKTAGSEGAGGRFPAKQACALLFVGDWAVGQLWPFWLAPIVGAMIGAVAYKFIASDET